MTWFDVTGWEYEQEYGRARAVLMSRYQMPELTIVLRQFHQLLTTTQLGPLQAVRGIMGETKEGQQ